MKMPPFEYACPATVDEAVQLLAIAMATPSRSPAARA